MLSSQRPSGPGPKVAGLKLKLQNSSLNGSPTSLAHPPSPRYDGRSENWVAEDSLWCENEDEEWQPFVGSARNFRFKGRGRVIDHRHLRNWAKGDHDAVTNLGLGPGASVAEPYQPDSGAHPSLSSPTPSPPSLARAGTSGLIRLLEVLPDGSYRLHTVELSKFAGHYDFLSYSSQLKTDGNGKGDYVGCNDLSQRVPQRLCHILERLRPPDASVIRLLWAPHVCINLNDSSDRQYHTELSKEIIKNARQTILYLGEDAMNDDYGISLPSVCYLVNSWRALRGVKDFMPEARWTQLSQMSPGKEEPSIDLVQAWNTATELLSDPVFTSAWSFSEICSAESVTVIKGGQAISWDWIGMAAAILLHNCGTLIGSSEAPSEPGKRPLANVGIINAYFLYRLSRAQRLLPFANTTIQDLLVLSSSFDTRDPLDKVYALFASPAQDSEGLAGKITPLYSKSPAELDQIVAYWLLQNPSELPRQLAMVQHEHDQVGQMPGSMVRKNLVAKGPSWCPRREYMASPEIIHFARPSVDLHQPGYEQSIPTVSFEGLDMKVQGSVIDEVVYEQDFRGFDRFWRGKDDSSYGIWYFSNPRATPAAKQEPDEELVALRDLLLSSRCTGEDLRQMALTLTCGKDWNGNPVPDQEQHVADFARCLIRKGLWWSLAWMKNFKDLQADRDLGPASESPLTLEGLRDLSTRGHADRFLDCAATMGWRRSCFHTSSRFWGLGPEAMVKGDTLWTIPGVEIPFIVRPCGDDKYQLIGECYVFEMTEARRFATLWKNSEPTESYLV